MRRLGPSTTRPPTVEEDLVEYFKKRLGLSDVDYARIMTEPAAVAGPSYPTYKKRFERLRPLFARPCPREPRAHELLSQVLLPGASAT